MRAFGLELGRDICEALGLDANTVSSFTLTVSCTEPASITIERWVESTEAGGLVEVIERYGLAPLDEVTDDTEVEP